MLLKILMIFYDFHTHQQLRKQNNAHHQSFISLFKANSATPIAVWRGARVYTERRETNAHSALAARQPLIVSQTPDADRGSYGLCSRFAAARGPPPRTAVGDEFLE
ncbi:hypothetical protein EVAR_63673_1 [Eumeta japonica]|uniref:Uncharacterized protein n=1 Tax=Eumeta variegata TaxID=151549 RepID=A0A4C1ZPY7_EUMVA|nr:hypothetical protein EVAR_63673_1 [Eumeta japonica]